MKAFFKVVMAGTALGGAFGGLFAQAAWLAAPYVDGLLFSSRDLPFPTSLYFFLFGLSVASALVLWVGVATRRSWLPSSESRSVVHRLSSTALIACSWPGAVLSGVVAYSVSPARWSPICFIVVFVVGGGLMHSVGQVALGGELRVWQAGVIMGCWVTPLLAVGVLPRYVDVSTPVVEVISAAGVTAASLFCIWGQSVYDNGTSRTEASN